MNNIAINLLGLGIAFLIFIIGWICARSICCDIPSYDLTECPDCRGHIIEVPPRCSKCMKMYYKKELREELEKEFQEKFNSTIIKQKRKYKRKKKND